MKMQGFTSLLQKWKTEKFNECLHNFSWIHFNKNWDISSINFFFVSGYNHHRSLNVVSSDCFFLNQMHSCYIVSWQTLKLNTSVTVCISYTFIILNSNNLKIYMYTVGVSFFKIVLLNRRETHTFKE